MKTRKLVPFIAILASTTLCSCGFLKMDFNFVDKFRELFKEPEREDQQQSGVNEDIVTPEKKYKYTVMYYMSGSTLEYDKDMGKGGGDRRQGYMTDDIKEILSVNFGNDVKVIIQTGGVKHYALETSSCWCAESDILSGKTEISDRYIQRWEVEACQEYKVDTMNARNVTLRNKLKFVAEENYNNMAKEESLESFLKWGLKDYSADNMGVIISGHGAGIGGCAFDDNYSEDSLNAAEIALASNNALKSYNRDKFTFLGFDCCLMACADIATVEADYYEYMVASQESEDAEGWRQATWLTNLVSNPRAETKTILQKIVDSFVGSSHTMCGYTEGGRRWPCYSTLSVLDLSKADNLVNAFENYVTAVGKNGSYYVDAYEDSYYFGEGSYGLVDFVDFLNNMDKEQEKKADVIEAIDDLVIYEKHCAEYEKSENVTPSGVNLFFPVNLDHDYDFQVWKSDYSSSNTKFNSWNDVCISYTQGWY